MRILHVASEVAPYSKTGGLGDVVGALPRALAGLGQDDEVAVVAPAYLVEAERFGLARRSEPVAVRLGGHTHPVEVLEGRLGEARAWLIDHEAFRRDGLYGPRGTQRDYPDNAFRFALLSRAALAVAHASGFAPDVVHAHDWQAGPALLYARTSQPDGDKPRPATVCTIHNLAFRGLFPLEVASVLDVPRALCRFDAAEFHGLLSFLKLGLTLADRITTVSPRYAEEIRTAEYGCGLDGFLRAHAGRLRGILNGIDDALWDPARDPALAVPYAGYSLDRLDGKRDCKAALQRELGLPVVPRAPLLGAVTRLTDQKGFDFAPAALARLLDEHEPGGGAEDAAQLVVLGSGEPGIEARLGALAARHPRRMALRLGYDEALAHRIYAGSDLFLMPSRWEPCGLGQLYALRYGAVPVVRRTGGLADTVRDCEERLGPDSDRGTGFVFDAPSADALHHALSRALAAYAEPTRFLAAQRRGMAEDHAWARSAVAYRALYEEALADPTRSK